MPPGTTAITPIRRPSTPRPSVPAEPPFVTPVATAKAMMLH